jgi:hypothetical protein
MSSWFAEEIVGRPGCCDSDDQVRVKESLARRPFVTVPEPLVAVQLPDARARIGRVSDQGSRHETRNISRLVCSRNTRLKGREGGRLCSVPCPMA